MQLQYLMTREWYVSVRCFFCFVSKKIDPIFLKDEFILDAKQHQVKVGYFRELSLTSLAQNRPTFNQHFVEVK